jgi:hypothetical protein
LKKLSNNIYIWKSKEYDIYLKKIKFHHLKGDITSRIVVYYIDGEMSKKTLVRVM